MTSCFQGMKVRRDPPSCVQVRVSSRAIRKRVHPDRNRAHDVRVGLWNCHSGFEPPDSLICETGQWLIIALERARHQNVEVLVDDAEPARHNADNRVRLRIDVDGAPDHGTVTTEALLPVAIAEDDVLWAVGYLIGSRQLPAFEWRNAEGLEYAVGNEDGMNLLGLRQPGEVGLASGPDPQRLQGPVVLAEREIHRGGERQTFLEVSEARRTRCVES